MKQTGGMIKEIVSLAFDPTKAGSGDVKDVFADDVARIIWLAVKQKHLTTPNFNRACLCISAEIKKMKNDGMIPLNEKVLFCMLTGKLASPTDILGQGEGGLEFARELLLFIKGERTISFQVNALGKLP